MAITFLSIFVSNPAKPDIKKKVNCLVDSGAIYSVIPTKVLRKLGIKPGREREFTLADGNTVVRKMSGARFEYSLREGFAPVVFGEEKDSALLGATALEAMGVALNPLERKLIPLPMVLG